MSSVVLICNQALANHAKPENYDNNEDNAEAKACKQY